MTLKRYVLDTNVLISAVLLPDSTASYAYELALDTGVLLSSSSTISEYQAVILRPKFNAYTSEKRRKAFLSELLQGVEQVDIVEKIHACRDPKDNRFLEVAVNGRADVLVSGDQDLLSLHPFQGINILNPADFLNIWSNS